MLIHYTALASQSVVTVMQSDDRQDDGSSQVEHTNGLYLCINDNKFTVHYLKPGTHKLNHCNNLLPLLSTVVLNSRDRQGNVWLP